MSFESWCALGCLILAVLCRVGLEFMEVDHFSFKSQGRGTDRCGRSMCDRGRSHRASDLRHCQARNHGREGSHHSQGGGRRRWNARH